MLITNIGKIKVGICLTFFNFKNRAKHLKLNYKRAKIERKKKYSILLKYLHLCFIRRQNNNCFSSIGREHKQ